MSFAHPASTPPLLVGRERELGVLREHLTAALHGKGSLVLIGGEAGIGKTASASAVCGEATEQGALVLVGRCYDLTETPPYGPWLELFASYPASDDLPPLPPALAERGTIGHVASRDDLFRQVLAFLRSLAVARPLVLLLDDLHWADAASLDLLRTLARTLANLPLLLLVAYRSDELTRRHPLYQLLPTLVREASATRLTVRPLTSEAIAALVRSRYVLSDADTTRLVAYLDAHGEGNPFFVAELLRALEEERALETRETGWALGDLTGVRVPSLLRQVVDTRLTHLDDETQELLAVAAVIGHEVPLAVWADVARVGEEALVGVTARAIEAHLLEGSGGDVRFSHALIREALFEGLAPPLRRVLHRRVGEVLADAPNADADAVASHFQRAGDARAAVWLIRAGEHAQALFADRAAAERFEAALALLDAHGADERERAWVLHFATGAYRYLDPPRALRYNAAAMRVAERVGDRLLLLGTVAFRVWLHQDAGRLVAGLADILTQQTLNESLTASEWAGARERSHFLVPGPHFEGGVVEYLALCGEFARARGLGERLVARLPDVDAGAERLAWDEAFSLGNCYYGLMVADLYQGDPASASRAAVRARACYGHVGWERMVGSIVRMECLSALAYAADRPDEWRRLAAEWDVQWSRAVRPGVGAAPRPGHALVLAAEGRWDEARTLTAAMLDDLRLLQRQGALLVVAELDRACGETEAAWAAVRAVLPEGPTASLVQQYRVQEPALRLGAGLALDEGDLSTARAWLGAHDALLARCAGVLGRSEGQVQWARYHRQSGAVDKALVCAERAVAHATEPRQPLALLAAYRLLGELETEAGVFGDAAHHLDTSLALADACEMPYERALTILAHAELRAATGDTEVANTALDEARTILERLGAKPALARADALAARRDAVTPRPPSHPAGLTAREVEVLRLVATGLSNAEIAERLFLSERTVEQHLRGVYNKLGSSSRTAATAFAFQHGLAGS